MSCFMSQKQLRRIIGPVKRRLSMLAALVLALGACGGAADDGGNSLEPPVDSTGAVETTVAPSTTSDASPPETGVTESTLGATTTTSDREVAPDFTLELGEGGTYTLSEGANPVFMVFWAEW